MKMLGAIVAALSLVTTTHAAVNSTRVKIKKSDITEVLQKNSETNTLLVQTKDGRKFSLKVSAEQIEDIERSVKLASTNNTQALKLATAAKTSKAATTSASATALTEEKNSPWGVSYANWTVGNINKLTNGEDEITMMHLPAIKYKLDSGYTLSFHPNFQMKYFQANGGTEHDLMALQARVTKGGFQLPWNVGLTLQGRYYLPTGETFKNSDNLGLLRLNAVFNKPLNDVVSLEYYASPRYYLNTVASIVEEDDFGRQVGDASGNTGFRYFHYFKVSQKLNDTFTPYQQIFLDHKWKLSDEEVGIEGGLQTNIGFDLGIGISAASWLSFDLSIGQNHNTSGTEGFSLFNSDELGYSVFTNFVIL